MLRAALAPDRRGGGKRHGHRGLSWQIIPTALMRMLGDGDPARAGAVAHAMLQMRRIEVPELQEACDRVGQQAWHAQQA